jgi:hypothetical protein
MHDSYYTQPAAHNVPFVDDKGQQGWGPGEVLFFDAESARLAVSQQSYTPDIGVNRTISLADGFFHDVVRFLPRPSSSSPKVMGLTWHFNCIMVGDEGLAPNPNAALPASEGFQHWTDVRPFKATGSANILLKCAGGDMSFKIQSTGAFEVFKARSPNLPAGTFRDAIYIRAPFNRVGFNNSFMPAVIN